MVVDMKNTNQGPVYGPLTLSQHRLLAFMASKPGTGRDIREAMGLPRTTSALKNVTLVTESLVSLGYIKREVADHGHTLLYTLIAGW